MGKEVFLKTIAQTILIYIIGYFLLVEWRRKGKMDPLVFMGEVISNQIWGWSSVS